MKASKALKRIAHAEELISDVMERYSATSPGIREVLHDAKTAVSRAKDAVNLAASSRTTSAQKKAVSTTKAVKVPPVKSTTKQRTTKRDYEE